MADVQRYLHGKEFAMKKSFHLYLTILLVLLLSGSSSLYAQESQIGRDTTFVTSNIEINIGFTYGGSAGNTASFLESGMEQSRLDQSVQGFFSIDYPISSGDGGSYNFSTRLFYKVNRGIALDIGRSAKIRGEGARYLENVNDLIPFEKFFIGYFNLESTMKIHHIAVGYAYRSPSKRAEVIIGPALLLHTLSIQDNVDERIRTQKSTTPALWVSGQLHLLNKQWFYLGLETSIKWGFKASFDEELFEVGDETIRYDPGNYSPFIFNLGLTAGFRLNFDKK